MNYDAFTDYFYADSVMRSIHLPKAKEFYEIIVSRLGMSPSSILVLNRTWLSEWMQSAGIDVTFPADMKAGDKFDLIIGLDEILTRDIDEASQKKHIMQIVGLLDTNGMMVASLRDYRNTNGHKKVLGDTCFNMVGTDEIVTVELNQIDPRDKQSWFQKYHMVTNSKTFECIDGGVHRTLYFKQLAKYCADSGAGQFGVLKDVYWRSHLRKTPEHIVWAMRNN